MQVPAGVGHTRPVTDGRAAPRGSRVTRWTDGRGDAKWLVPLGASAAVLFATDRHTAGEASEGGANPSRVRISRDISRGGDFYTTGGIAAVFYLAGRARHNARARETGV